MRGLVLTLFLSASVAALNDKYWKYAWHLNPEARGYGVHLNVADVWQHYTGKGVKVAVVDGGIAKGAQELKGKIVDRIDNRPKDWPWSDVDTSFHSMSAAALIAAKHDNGLCSAGVAPGADVVDIPIFKASGAPSDQLKGKALKPGLTGYDIDIYSNSWGTFDGGASLDKMPKPVAEALAAGAQQGRNKKGAIYVWAAGNGGINGDSCAYDPFVNSEYTIAVTGISREGKKLKAGEACTAVMATAPSRDTDAGYGKDSILAPTADGTGCGYRFSESSVAPPMTAGVIALALEANPRLSWRDVQHLIAHTSNPCVGEQSTYITNGAGFKVSPAFGFGLLNTKEMTSLATMWTSVGDVVTCTASVQPARQANKQRQSYSFRRGNMTCTGGQDIAFLESVVAIITAKGPTRGAVKLDLVSPAATKAALLPGRWQDWYQVGLTNWQVQAVSFWGEPLGSNDQQWNLRFSGLSSDSIPTVQLKFFGLAKKVVSQRTKQTCTYPAQNELNRHISELSQCRLWSDFSACSVTCGQGTQVRTRQCRDRFDMETWGQESESQQCFAGNCPTQKPWTPKPTHSVTQSSKLVNCRKLRGQDWSDCSNSCGGGIKSRVAECWNNETSIRGSEVQTQQCNAQPCATRPPQPSTPRQGGYTDCKSVGTTGFYAWSACDKPCGGGVSRRVANCYNPATGVRGYTTQSQACNTQACVQRTSPVPRTTPGFQGPSTPEPKCTFQPLSGCSTTRGQCGRYVLQNCDNGVNGVTAQLCDINDC